MQIDLSISLLFVGLVAGSIAGAIGSGSTVETGRLDDQSLQLAIKTYPSVEQVYFPNLNQVMRTLNLIIQNASLPGECKRSLIQLSSGMRSRETWALSCK